MAKIWNHKMGSIHLRPRQNNGLAGMMMGVEEIVIEPGKCKEVPFWDEIKNSRAYQNMLDRRHLTVGSSDPAVPGGSEPFSSHGDTLSPPLNLQSKTIEDTTTEEGKMDPVISSVSPFNPSPVVSPKRRGRPARVPEADVSPVAGA